MPSTKNNPFDNLFMTMISMHAFNSIIQSFFLIGFL